MRSTATVLLALLVATAAFTAATGTASPSWTARNGTILSCAYPTSFVPFSVFSAQVNWMQQQQHDSKKPKHEKKSHSCSLDAGFTPVTAPQGINFNAHVRPTQPHDTPALKADPLVVYSSDVNGAVELYVTGLNNKNSSASTPPILVASDSISLNDHGRFSPDGRSLAFISTRDENPVGNSTSWAALFVVADIMSCVRSGGIKTTTATTTTSSSPACQATRITPVGIADFSPAWSPDGKYIAVATGSGAPGESDIAAIELDPLTRSKALSRRIVARNGGWPSFVNNHGDEIIFHRAVGPTVAGPWSLFTVSLSSGVQRYFRENALTPFVAHDNNILVFATLDSDGHRQIHALNLTTMEATAVTSGTSHHYNPTVFVDKSTSATTTVTVLFHRCRHGDPFPLVRTRRNIEPGFSSVAYVAGDFPTMSPDGALLANIGIPNGNVSQFTNVNLMSNNGDYSTFSQVFSGGAWQISWDLSSGSSQQQKQQQQQQRLTFTAGPAFSTANDGKNQVWSVREDGSELKQVTFGPEWNQGYPAFSPDGEWIVFRTARPCIAGGLALRPAHNGSFPGLYSLAKVRSDGTGPVISVTCYLNTTKSSGFIGDTHPSWSADGTTIVFASDRGHAQRTSIWIVSPDGSGLHEVFDRGAMSVHPAIYTSPSSALRIVFTTTYFGFSMEAISWPFGFVFEAELASCDLNGDTLLRLTHDAGENANVFVGPHPLPTEKMATTGPKLDCIYLDSVQPADPFLLQEGEDGHGAIPLKQMRRNEMLKHGVFSFPATARDKLPSAFPNSRRFDMCLNASAAKSQQQQGEQQLTVSTSRPFPHGYRHVWEDTETFEERARKDGCPYFNFKRNLNKKR